MRLPTTPSHRSSEPRRVLIRPLLPQSHNPSFYSQNPRLFRQTNEFTLSPHPAPFSKASQLLRKSFHRTPRKFSVSRPARPQLHCRDTTRSTHDYVSRQDTQSHSRPQSRRHLQLPQGILETHPKTSVT